MMGIGYIYVSNIIYVYEMDMSGWHCSLSLDLRESTLEFIYEHYIGKNFKDEIMGDLYDEIKKGLTGAIEKVIWK